MSMFKNVCLVIILLLMLTVVFLIGTTRGMHIVLNSVAHHWIPGLKITSVNGSWRNLTIKQLHYQIPGVMVSVGTFHISLDFNYLWNYQLYINDLSLLDVIININTSEFGLLQPIIIHKASVSDLLSTPYPINVRCITLNNLQIKVDHTRISLDKCSTGFQFQGNNLTLKPTRIAGLLLELPTATQVAIGKVSAIAQTIKYDSQTSSLAERLRALFAKPLLPPLHSLILPLNLAIEDIEGENICLSSNVNFLITQLHLQAVIRNLHIQLKLLDIISSQGILNAFGTAQFSGRWPISITINTILNNEPLKGEQVRIAVDGDLRDELHAALNFSGPLTAQLVIKTRLAQVGLPIRLMLQGQSLQWPLTGTPQYQARSFTLRLDGTAKDYRLKLKAVLSGNKLPIADLSLDAKGNTDGFTLSHLRLSTLQGSTDLSAAIDWQRAISWHSKLSLNGINTARQWPNWSSRLDGKLISCGSLYSGSWQLQVPELDLHGYIRQNALIVKGSLKGNDSGQWQIQNLMLILGRNQLMIKGELNDLFSLDLVLNAQALSNVLPKLNGRMAGHIKLRGNLREPKLLMNLNAYALRWGELTVDHIAFQGDICSRDIIRSNIQLHLDRLSQESRFISQLTLDMKGDEKQHQLDLIIQGEAVAGRFQLNGNFDRQRQRWQGVLNQTCFTTPVGRWWMTQAISIDYHAVTHNLIIGPHCWQNPNVMICMPKNTEIGALSGQVSLILNRCNLAILKSLIPVTTQISGIFTGQADIRWTTESSRLLEGKVALIGNGVKVSQILKGKMLPVAFEVLTFNAELNNGLAHFNWFFKAVGNGQFNGQIEMANPKNCQTLSGNIHIKQLSLALLKPLISLDENIDGFANAELRLSGNLRRPQLHGQLGLEHLIINGNFIPFVMTDSHLALSFFGSRSMLQGFIGTTHGQLNLTGEADWSRMTAWYWRINAQGHRIRITVSPMIRLDVSPDIMFKATPKLFILNGKIDMPWAYIEVKDMPKSTFSISSDEVLLDDQLRPIIDQENTAAPLFISNLLVHIGDNVNLDAFGLKARFKGDLKVVQDRKGMGLNGQINILSGCFHTYGKDLIVNKGQLIFSGPVYQPYLNIEAIRNPDSTKDNVIAGVRITGLADQPKIEVFSDPIKSQQEALSYLLSGQGLDASGIDSNMMTSMLIGVGVAKSKQFIGKIGQTFGVNELTLDMQGIGDNSKVVVSGYIVPGFQVKYGIGIFDSLGTLTLRCRLMSKLYLEAVFSSLNQTLDVLYRFEF